MGGDHHHYFKLFSVLTVLILGKYTWWEKREMSWQGKDGCGMSREYDPYGVILGDKYFPPKNMSVCGKTGGKENLNFKFH